MTISTQSTSAARAKFAEQGLPFPWIPAELADHFQPVDEWLYATRTDMPSPYDIAWFAQEVGTEPVDDYVLYGYAGRGMNSYAIHYYLVRGPLALFVQTSWGGIYTENDKSSRLLAKQLQQAETLATTVAAVQVRGGFHPDERLIVMISDFYGANWIRQHGLVEKDRFGRTGDWRKDDDPLTTLIERLGHE